MSLRLKIYVGAVLAIAVLVLSQTFPGDWRTNGLHYLAWIAICAASEGLWLPAMSGTGTGTKASTAGLAAMMIWGQSPACWIAPISSLIGELVVLRKPLIRAGFNAGQITLTTWVASAAFAWLGGTLQGLRHLDRVGIGDLGALRLAPAVLGMIITYFILNRAFTAGAVAWSTERPYMRVLREDWFYAEQLINDAGTFLLSPLMALSFEAIGYVGVALFYAPLELIRVSHRRFIELKKAQQMIIHTERMAAKGEMAAEIGHELRNILSAISARAQMITKESERGVYTNLPRNTQIILEQSKRMETMSRGLMDFSGAELKIERVELNPLILRAMELVQTTNRFDGVAWDLHLSELNPELRADPGQLHQVFLNLFMNAADAMNEQKDGDRRPKCISVTTQRDDPARKVTIIVADTGPGIPGSNLTRIFEPHFTTKPTGHGFGLSTSYRIIENHKGRIIAESPPGQGACFTITLPVQPGGWS